MNAIKANKQKETIAITENTKIAKFQKRKQLNADLGLEGATQKVLPPYLHCLGPKASDL